MTTSLNGARASAAPWRDKATEIESAWAALASDLREKRLDQTEPYEVELPGFPPVLALRMPIRLLMAKGRIPDALTPFILVLAQTVSDEASAVKATGEMPDEYADLLNAVWTACVIAPASVPVVDVPHQAKDALFAWANGVDEAVRAFRRSGDAARVAPDGEGVRPGPAEDAGDRSEPGIVAGVAGPQSDVLRGPDRGITTQPNAASAEGKRAGRAKGIALEPGAEVDLGAGGRPGAAANRRGRRSSGASRRDAA